MSMVGIIGGSGLDDPRFFENPREVKLDTPYGALSSPLRCGKLDGRDVVLLARHGRHHEIPPSQINNRANIWALREVGCSHILATAACGSLREEIGRGVIVLPDQFIDFTRHRAVTFHDRFEPGAENARHCPMADPFDHELRQIILTAGGHLGIPVRDGGVILTIEGPRFSTRAESRMFRVWGADLINMTVAPEAILANELGLPYAVIAVVTDFDSWREGEPPLRVDELLSVFGDNVGRVTRLILDAAPGIADTETLNTEHCRVIPSENAGCATPTSRLRQG
ncbi:MAG: S-methyl-5'-thioadenosine phosphorylase [Lentisphaeria bacterium]|nr:S-methyl-5'-thioadenosine phosphorylase [Lentisphaeria bacterium]